MDKTTKVILLSCAVLISLSTIYYLVIRPMQKDKPLRDCLADAERIHVTRTALQEQNPINTYAAYQDAQEQCYKKFGR